MKLDFRQMKIYRQALLLLILALVIYSCDADRFFDHSKTLPESGWHKDSILSFAVDVQDTSGLYDFYITLRNSSNYQYRNFYLFFSTTLPNNNITRDTIELMLASLEGKWLGKGFGALKDNQILIRKNLKFPLRGTYIFKIEQAMRLENLSGIKNIGIRIERAK